jgi:hypothetical protein
MGSSDKPPPEVLEQLACESRRRLRVLEEHLAEIQRVTTELAELNAKAKEVRPLDYEAAPTATTLPAGPTALAPGAEAEFLGPPGTDGGLAPQPSPLPHSPEDQLSSEATGGNPAPLEVSGQLEGPAIR